MIRRLECALVILVCTAGCDNSARRGGGANGGPCQDGDHQCSGRIFQTCQGGAWTNEKTCTTDQVCSAAGMPKDLYGPLNCGPWEG